MKKLKTLICFAVFAVAMLFSGFAISPMTANAVSTKTKPKTGKKCMEKMFLRVADVMEILGVSESYAYKLIRKLNKEMQEMGFQTIQGIIDTKFPIDF